MSTSGTSPRLITDAERRELRARSLAWKRLVRVCRTARDELAWERFEAATDDQATIQRAAQLVEEALSLCRDTLGIPRPTAMTDREANPHPPGACRKADSFNGQDPPRRG